MGGVEDAILSGSAVSTPTCTHTPPHPHPPTHTTTHPRSHPGGLAVTSAPVHRTHTHIAVSQAV
eukprot:NODE_7112_length_291_cov_266.537190_g5952_i0.p1 GENE.NODE_7112_length_291_cov_266.537190_g5952_i0~~NODE_7112_length_291_cov_266.537190_g5952_i0.p1  ORF type:complete len:73 (+),score=47.36 NODE_7112_length_291_cov_266.537190_g5952_i0:29-220(+)